MIKISGNILAIFLAMHTSIISNDTFRMGLSLGNSLHDSYIKTILGDKKEKINAKSPSYGLFLGVDYKIVGSPIFVGMEFSLINNKSEKEKYLINIARGTSFNLKTSYSLKQLIRCGVILNEIENEILLYGIAGISSTNWQTIIKDQLEHRNEFQKHGLTSGFGMESKINQNVSVGFQYELTLNNEMRKLHPTLELKLKPVVQNTSLRLTYSF